MAFSNAVFHWVPDQVALLKSVAGVLDDGGLLVAEMGAHGNIARIEEGYTQALRKHSGDYSGRFCFPREGAYRRLLGIAGFEVELMEAFDRPTPLPGGSRPARTTSGMMGPAAGSPTTACCASPPARSAPSAAPAAWPS